MEVIRQILEILRDLGIVIGIPTLIALCLRMMQLRIEVLKDRIALLEKTQFPNALTLVQSQKSLYEMEERQLRQRLRELEKASSPDIKEKEAIEEDIHAVNQSIDSLEKIRKDIADGIESEAVRKFELFCRELTDPDDFTPDYIFMSGTYGSGIGAVEANALERKGVIEIRNGNIYLTPKGKGIWEELQHLEMQRR